MKFYFTTAFFKTFLFTCLICSCLSSMHGQCTDPDIEAPTIVCPSDITLTNELGLCGALVVYSDPVVTDNCDLPIMPIVPLNFTTAGNTGPLGPIQSQIDLAYTGTDLDGNVTIVQQGIQEWVVPVTGTYKISAFGAQGGSDEGATGGLGAEVAGEFNLVAGDILRILVGQTGNNSGGGGGTFVATSTNTPLIVAGGGAGTGDGNGGDGRVDIGGAGSAGAGQSTGCGAAGGGGFFGNASNFDFANGGDSFISGGQGGVDNSCDNSNSFGGFGGGASGGHRDNAGGGGGYNGGFGRWIGIGQGGSSFNAGLNPITIAGVNSGAGSVLIESLTGSQSSQMLTLLEGLPSGSLFPLGTTTNTYMATDASGNTGTCSFDVTVVYSGMPFIECPVDAFVSTSDGGQGDCEGQHTWTIPLAVDNCQIASFSVTYTNPDGSIDGPTNALVYTPMNDANQSGTGVSTTATRNFSSMNGGVTVVTYFVEDYMGNVFSCSFTVTVTDDEAPEFVNCQMTNTIDVFSSECETSVFWDIPSAVDNCTNQVGLVTQTGGPTFGSILSPGVYTVEYTAMDQAGLTDICSFDINVIDTENPLIYCPSQSVFTILNTDIGACEHVVTTDNLNATFSENCPTPTLTHDYTSASSMDNTTLNGHTFPVGLTTVTWTATDGSGNAASCSFAVSVEDTEAPILECPEDILVSNDVGVCGALVVYEEPAILDNCFLGSIPNTVEEFLFTGGVQTFVVPTGVSEIFIEAFGASGGDGIFSGSTGAGGMGGFSSGTLPVTPGEIINIYVGGEGGSTPNGASAGGFNGGGRGNGSGNGTRGGGGGASDIRQGGTGLSNRVLVAGGGGGACCFGPAGNGGGLIGETTNVSNSDGTGGTQNNGGLAGCSFCCGGNMDMDGRLGQGGNSPPGCGNTLAGGGGGFYGGGSGNNAGGGSSFIGGVLNGMTTTGGQLGDGLVLISYEIISTSTTMQIEGLPSGSIFPVGTTTNTFLISDAAGNTTTCSFLVNVSDVESPIFNCPADVLVTTASGEGDQCAGQVVWDVPVPSDNCAIINYTVTYTNPNATIEGPFPAFVFSPETSIANGVSQANREFELGETIITYYAEDTEGNTATCSFSVIVPEALVPQVQNATLEGCPNSSEQAVATFDLTAANVDVSGAGNVTYYNSLLGAQNADVNDLITNFTAFESQSKTIHARVESISGCYNVASIWLVVSASPAPTIEACTTTPTLCDGDAIILSSTIVNGTPPFTVAWTESVTGFTSIGENLNIVPSDTGYPTVAGLYTYSVVVTSMTGCTNMATVDVQFNAAPLAIDPADVTNAIFCSSNKGQGSAPIKNIIYSTGVLSVDASNVCANVSLGGGPTCSGVDTPAASIQWYATATGGSPLFDIDTNADGINDADADGDESTFNPIAAGLVDPNVPGEFIYYVEAVCANTASCTTPTRTAVTLTILDCEIDSGCTYLLVLEDTGANGWEGASIDVTIDESPMAIEYKLTAADCDLLLIPLSTNDGGSIDFVYHSGSNEEENSWFVLDPNGNIALDINEVPLNYGPTPLDNEKLTLKLDCPTNCEETEDYYIVNTIGDFAANQVWELRKASGELVAFNTFDQYNGLAAGTIVIDTVQLATCEDYSFVSFAPNSIVWSNASWQILGSDADRGLAITEGAFTGLFEIAGGPNGTFVDEQVTDFNIPCKPEDCPSDQLRFANDLNNCQRAGFIHPSPPTPFVCYPTGCYSNTTPVVSISYPDLGINRVDVGTAVTLPVGSNLVVFEITYGGVQTVRCSSFVNIVIDFNPVIVCNDNLNVSLSNPADLSSGGDCFREVSIDEVLEGQQVCSAEFELVIFDVSGNSLEPANTVGADQVGQTLTYIVSHIGSGNTCQGTLLIEDKNAPIIACSDYEVDCTHPNVMDENFTHVESFSAIGLPANISGSTGSSISTTIQVDNTPVGEIIQSISLDIVNNHSRISDLNVTITSPSGQSVTSGLPVSPDSFVDFFGSSFTSISGAWDVTIVDNNGNESEGNFGQGSIFEINLNVQSGFPQPFLVLDCSEVAFSVIAEVIEDTNCDQGDWLGARLVRTWQAIDASGNASSCEQIIGLRAPKMSDINLPEDMNFECGVVSLDPEAITPAISGAPNFGSYAIGTDYLDICDVVVTFEDKVNSLCGNSFSITRTWTITNLCSSTSNTHVQLIRVDDTDGPVINSSDIQFGTGTDDCATGNVFLSPAVSDLCSAVQSIVASYTIGGGVFGNSGQHVIQDITNGSALNDLPFGLTQINILATDNCGNTTEVLVDVNVTDSSAPVAICNDELNISLNSSGIAVLSASDLDEGSTDNCGIASILARRVSGCMDTTAWATIIPFECCDADEMIMVELLVTDLSGSTNTCWAEVFVEDPIGPQITCEPNTTVTCDEALHADDLFVTPTGSDNCDSTVEEGGVITVDLPNCGQILTKTFTVSDNSDKTDEATCIQTITVEHVSDFIVQFPADVEFDGCELGAIVEPIITDGECEMISISSEDRVFTQTVDACYLIERTWTVINQCIVDNPGAGGFTDGGTPLPIPRTFRDDDGYFQYVQVITVNDEVAPTVAFTAPDPCDFTDGCTGTVVLTATGEDDCSDLADLSFSWKIDAGSTGAFGLEGTGADASGTYPYGDHIIKWTVTDGCGNATSMEYDFSVEDCKNPTPIADGLATVAMNNGACVTISAAHLLKKAEDNCTVRTVEEWQANARVRAEGSNGALATQIQVCCTDVVNGGVNVEVWVEDEAGNQDFVIVFVDVQDNSGNCPAAGIGSSLLAGRLTTEFGNNVENATVSIDGNIVMTDATGLYSTIQTTDEMYNVTPEKLDGFEQYLSTLDIVYMARHVLQINQLTTPYQLIAADVDADGDVDIFDLVELRQVVLFAITDGFTNNTSWRFVDAAYTFQNPVAPWSEAYPQYIDAMLTNDLMNEDFVAVKIGDLDGSAAAPFNSLEERSFPTTLTMNIDDVEMSAGNEYKVDFRASDFNDILGYQFTMNFDQNAADFISVEAGALKVDKGNFGFAMLDEGIVTTSFTEMGKGISVNDDEVLFSINLTAKTNAALHNVLSLINEYTLAEAYNTENEVSDVKIVFNNGELLATDGDQFKLFQNTPNPFSNKTQIGFVLPESAEATITLYDITGKVVYTITDNFERGYNEIQLIRTDINEVGPLIYQFRSAQYSAERKMILID